MCDSCKTSDNNAKRHSIMSSIETRLEFNEFVSFVEFSVNFLFVFVVDNVFSCLASFNKTKYRLDFVVNFSKHTNLLL